MKKILMGLLAVSAISFAANVNLGATATEDTNVFQTGQFGKIMVEGKVTSSVPVVKYVVFASTGDGSTVGDEKLLLTDYIETQDPSTSRFTGTNPKVYVKKVKAGDSGVDALETEKVRFRVNLDPFYVNADGLTVLKRFFGEGENLQVNATALLSKTTLENLVTVSGITGYVVNDWGHIAKRGSAFRTGKSIKFNSIENGVLEVTAVDNPHWNEDRMQGSDAEALLTALAGGKPLTDVSITVEVK